MWWYVKLEIPIWGCFSGDASAIIAPDEGRTGNSISRERSFRLRVVYAVLTLHKRILASLKSFCPSHWKYFPPFSNFAFQHGRLSVVYAIVMFIILNLFFFSGKGGLCLFLVHSINFDDAIVFKFKFLWLDVFWQATGNLVFFSILIKSWLLVVTFFIIVFLRNEKYILVAFSFLLLSCREKKQFVIMMILLLFVIIMIKGLSLHLCI